MAGNANSGNRSGDPRPRTEKPFAEALRMEIKAAGDDHKELRTIARVLIARAKSGDIAAVQEIANRLDGKPTQIIDGTMEHQHSFVRAPEKASDDEWKSFLAQRDKASAPPAKRTNGRGNGTAH